ncbi:MAG: TIGR01459 family HAD-type hydrolase [Chlamydiae bacterium]|nr:TIGR01459 family HAD-type hydrolase [Chlamydiota bacterium]
MRKDKFPDRLDCASQPAEELHVLQFDDLVDLYDYFLLDASGVFWGSSETGMLPGARETMGHLVSLGKKVGILSNSSQLAAKEKAKLAKHGVQEGSHYHFLLTSGEVTKELLISEKLSFPTPKKKYWLFGVDHPRFASHSILFQDTGYSQTKCLEEADFIYIAIPHIDGIDQENPEVFLKQIKDVIKAVPVLCANPDHFVPEGLLKRLVVRQGMIAHMFQNQGAQVNFIGKPFSTVYEKALQLFPVALQPEKILMIGDTPETDIRGARQMGMATALVTKTGVMHQRIGEKQPLFVITNLPKTDQPDYAIESFKIYGF